MATINTVKLSQLEGAKRIDAEFYQPVFDTLKVIEKAGTKRLGSISQISYGTTPAGAEFYSEGVPFIRSQDFSFLIIDEKNIVFCSREFHNRNKKSEIKPRDLLFAAVGGTIGQVGIVQDWLKEGNINQNIARVRFIDKKFLPEFGIFFFLSKYGQLQIFRLVTGNAQPYLNSYQIKSLKLPLINRSCQEELKTLFETIQNELKKSIDLYSQAETLLLQELGLKDFKPQYHLSYATTFSNTFNTHRIDAEYFQPIYEEVINRIKSYKNGFDKLLNCVENVKADFNPYRLPNKVFSYVELADINTSVGIIESSKQIKGDEAPSRARRIIKQGDVIVSRVEGSLEKVALVSEDFENSLASTGFFQFRPFKISPQVLLVLAKSLILQIQFKRECAGTILTAIPEKALTRFIIPILPDDIQQKVSSLVQQSHQARQKAKQLLEEAKRKVEKEIEKELWKK